MSKAPAAPSSLLSQIQPVLDKLFEDRLMPFQLTAATVKSLGHNEYIIRFHDSRLRSIDISWRPDQSFDDVLRVAVLKRVSRLSGH